VESAFKHLGFHSRSHLGDAYSFECDHCGRFKMNGTLYESVLKKIMLSALQRAALSHVIRRQSDESGVEFAFGNSDDFAKLSASARLPSPAVQAMNAIAFIGDHVLNTGEKLPALPRGMAAIFGTPSREFANDLAVELSRSGVIDGLERPAMGVESRLMQVALTLGGWKQYEAEKKGKLSGRYGFLAMKFNDGVLEKFASEVIKPCVKEILNIEVIDIRDRSRAGVIDNILREQIRDARFVLADLTHDNYGAYWEAGYAEGLGKPVIYLCEKTKFTIAKPHFDTNHSCVPAILAQRDARNIFAIFHFSPRTVCLNWFSTLLGACPKI